MWWWVGTIRKPPCVLKWLIEKASNPGDIVFDPFSGVVITGVAALELGRKFIGCELDPGYYEAGLNRLREVFSELGTVKC